MPATLMSRKAWLIKLSQAWNKAEPDHVIKAIAQFIVLGEFLLKTLLKST